jgi:hypothetical protein
VTFCIAACEERRSGVPVEVLDQINRLDLAANIASEARTQFVKNSRTSQELIIRPRGSQSIGSDLDLIARNIESDDDLAILIKAIEDAMPVGTRVTLMSFVDSDTGFGARESVRLIGASSE